MSETATKTRLLKFLKDATEGYSGVTVTNFDSRLAFLTYSPSPATPF